MPSLISLNLNRSILADFLSVAEGASYAVREHYVSGIDRIRVRSLRVGFGLWLGSCKLNRRMAEGTADGRADVSFDAR
jgi:hypothetical protein